MLASISEITNTLKGFTSLLTLKNEQSFVKQPFRELPVDCPLRKAQTTTAAYTTTNC